MRPPSEKAIIVRYDILAGATRHDQAADEALAELTSLMAEGWLVKHAYPMSGTQMQSACSLVILERSCEHR